MADRIELVVGPAIDSLRALPAGQREVLLMRFVDEEGDFDVAAAEPKK